jgi:CubicO group peptidase (beta-lactamase class C family)
LRLQLNGGVYEGKRLISEKQLAETHTPQMVIRMEERAKRQNPETTQQSYGLGWRIEHYRGRMIIAHAGVLDGYRALVTMVPEKKMGIVVLSNLGRANVPETLTNMIVDRALGLAEKDWFTLQKSLADQFAAEDRAKEKERLAKRVPNTKPSHDLTAYAGVYEEPAYGRVTVRANSPLEIEWAGFGAKLEHFHFDTFTAKAANPLEDATVQFELDAAGEVVRLRILDKVFTRMAEKK